MEPPSFPASSLQTVRAAPGSDGELVLPLPNGTPPFHFEWSRAGAALDDRFAASEGAGGVRLTVSSARTGDSGVYTLQASNAAGSDTRRMRLEVSAEEAPIGNDPPTFLRRLQDLTVKVGTRTRFLVEIISSTECKVTWYRNERRLMEAERVALVRDGNFWCADVATVSVDDAGRWTCTAENAGGRASCSAHLNVLVPKAYKRPEFVEELRALLTEQGTVSLECKVVGVPTPVLRWFKDSREIKAGDVFALTASAEDPTSLGTYTCEAVNCMGRAYSSSKVHVMGRAPKDGSLRPISGAVTPEPPPIFTKELEDQFVKICEHLTLSCHIVVPPWPRSVVWYNKEGKIEPSERYHVIEDGVGGYLLEVASAEWADEGEWKCVATSSGGRLGISTCYVTMDVPKNFRKPRFMENLQAVLTEEGLVSFECKVVGFPTPVLSWFKDGQELKPGDVYQLTGTNSLGSYCCIARNCMGQASSSAELTVEDIQNQLNEEEKLQLFSKNQAPKFLQGLKSVEAKIDEPFRFTIKVAIPPEPSVLWYRDDQPIDESPRCHLGKEERGTFFLDIQNLEFLDQAEWKCVAMNDFGHSVTSCFLKLIIPRHFKKPRFLENLQAILSEEGAVNLECKVIGVPQPVLKWYKDGEELKPGDIHRIISGQDGTCCLGTYTCEAQNCMGIAASSASLLGFEDSIRTNSKKKADEQSLQRNLSLSTIHEERTSQMYDTPMGDVTLDDKGEISFSFDGKEVSVSLYETPDLTEEEALQIVEMYADQLSENITEHNVVELPPLRFVKETSTSGNLLMEAIIIDVSPEYFTSPEEDLRTEADIEDISIADENVPSQLSLDQDMSVEERIMAILSNEKPSMSSNLKRKKSDSQKSGDDYFSLSKDHSISEEKQDDDTQLLSESDLQSFASAHSSEKPIKSGTILEDGLELFETKKLAEVCKSKRERKSSQGSRKSSSGSEKLKEDLEKQVNVIHETSPQKKFRGEVSNISSLLNNIINDIQNLEKDVILKSEIMSSSATASKSLEIINSLLAPLSEIHSVTDAVIESIIENNDVSNALFVKLSQSLKSLQQSLTIIEKCVDVGNDNRTLVKKTCISLIENCGAKLQDLMMNVKSITINSCFKIEKEVASDIESVTNDVVTIVNFTNDTIKTRSLLIEAFELQSNALTDEAKHLRDTQKCIFNLKRPLFSLLSIVENAERGKITDVVNVNNSKVILADMSASIQDLQSALEQVELLSLNETSTTFNKYNTEIIDIVMTPVLELRNSFESISSESTNDDSDVALKQKLVSVKNNLNFISLHLNDIEKKVGTFDILQSDNKLEALQTMAQILISLENNLPRLAAFSDIKNHMKLFHKQLTKALENVIDSNEGKKYFDLIEICDAVKRINNSVHDVDSQSELCLASINNTLQIINDCLEKNVFDNELNMSIISNISELRVCIQVFLNRAEDLSFEVRSEHIHEMPESTHQENKVNFVVENIDRTIATIATVTAMQSSQEQGTLILPALENILPILEELKRKIASLGFSGVENEEHVSEITDISSQAAETLAKPLHELNHYISEVNEVLLENPGSIKECNQQIITFAQPLNELYTTLVTIQHDVISQLGDTLSPYEFNLDIANAVQNLQSAILMVNENIGLEATDELSTLDDISCLKTTADTVLSEKLDVLNIEQKDLQQVLESVTQEKPMSCIENVLYALKEHIIKVRNEESKGILDVLLQKSSTTTSSLFDELTEVYIKIEDIIHSNMLDGGEYVTMMVALVKPMLALEQSLSVVDTNNIPIFEYNLDFSSDSIHSVYKNISELINHLKKCVQVIVTATEVTDNTIEISKNINKLKRSCELFTNTLSTFSMILAEKTLPLNMAIKTFLEATDCSQAININEIKVHTAKLHTEILTIHEDTFSLTLQPLKEMQQEINLFEFLQEIESAIIVLEQNNFGYVLESLDIEFCSPQIAKVSSGTEELTRLEDIITKELTCCQQDSKQYCNNIFQQEVEILLHTCKKKLFILNYLINKPLSFKSIVRLYQEYMSLLLMISEFNLKKLKYNLSNEINIYLTDYLDNINSFLEIARSVILKIFETQNEMLIKTYLEDLINNSLLLTNMVEKCVSSETRDLINAFLHIKEINIENFNSLYFHIVSTLKSITCPELGIVKSADSDKLNYFTNKVEEMLLNNISEIENKGKVEEIIHYLQSISSLDDTTGFTKQLLLLKCMSECSQILKELVISNQVIQDSNYNDKVSLTITLKEMIVSLKGLNKKLIELQDNKIPEKSTLLISSLESCIQTAANIHEEAKRHIELGQYVVMPTDKVMALEIYDQIQQFKKNKTFIDSEQHLFAKESLSTVENVEKSVLTILSSDKIQEEKLTLQEKSNIIYADLKKYMESAENIEKISTIVQVEEVVESKKIAQELCVFLTSDSTDDEQNEAKFLKKICNNTERLLKLQKAIQMIYIEFLEHYEDIGILLGKDDLQVVTKNLEDLLVDLLAVTEVQYTVKEDIPIDKLFDKNIDSNDVIEVDKHTEGAVENLSQVTVENTEIFEIKETVECCDLNSITTIIEPDLNFGPITEIAQDDDSIKINVSETLNPLPKNVAMENEGLAMDTTSLLGARITNEENIYGKIINNIDVLLSHECNEVTNKLRLLSKELNADEIVKLATALKEKLLHATAVQTSSENEVFNLLKVDNRNLALKLQNAVSVMQGVIQEEYQNWFTEFEKVDLEYFNNVLANLSFALNSISSLEQEIQLTVTQEEPEQFQICGLIPSEHVEEIVLNDVHEETLTEIVSCIETSTSDYQLDTQKPKSDETYSENVEEKEILPVATEIAKHLVENDNVKEQIVSSDNNEFIEPKDSHLIYDFENIMDLQQLSRESVSQDNSMQRLTSLLEEVSDKIDTSAAVRSVDDIENLQDTLDEIQAVIIKIKRDYDGSANDNLNETLEDLECSVRSVQLQIHENSPPELLKEACATLQLLVTNMSATQNVQAIKITSHLEKLENILQSCSSDTQDTINLLEEALNMSVDDESCLNILFDGVNELKLIIKSLKSNFNDNIETLVEKGIEIMQKLDQAEDRVFSLEKDVDSNKKLNSLQRDNLVTAIHSIYGTISNMRSAMTSVQKQYMFENYGKSSEQVLIALKDLKLIAINIGKEWKSLSKSLRRVLNHFEDIKFYINFDKTARLPSDSTFTKIILHDLKAVVTKLLLETEEQFNSDVIVNTTSLIKNIEDDLAKIENQPSLEVKDKIPIFKNISQNICILTECIKKYIESTENVEKQQVIEMKVDQTIIEEVNINTNVTSDQTNQLTNQLDKGENEILNKSVDDINPCIAQDVDQMGKNNVPICNKDTDVHENVLNINKSNEKTNIILEKYVSNFALEVFPESIFTENIAEILLLQLEVLKPLRATSSQTVETRVLYESKVTEVVTEICIKEHIKSDSTNLNNNFDITDSVEEEQSSHEIEKTTEVISEKNNNRGKKDSTLEYQRESTDINKAEIDMKIEQTPQNQSEKGEDLYQRKEDSTVEYLTESTNIKQEGTITAVQQTPQSKSETKNDDEDRKGNSKLTIQEEINDIKSQATDIRTEQSLQKQSEVGKDNNEEKECNTVTCLKENIDTEQDKKEGNIEDFHRSSLEMEVDNNNKKDITAIKNLQESVNNEQGGEDFKIEESLQDNSKDMKDNNKSEVGKGNNDEKEINTVTCLKDNTDTEQDKKEGEIEDFQRSSLEMEVDNNNKKDITAIKNLQESVNNEQGGEDFKIEESLQDNSKDIKDNNKFEVGKGNNDEKEVNTVTCLKENTGTEQDKKEGEIEDFQRSSLEMEVDNNNKKDITAIKNLQESVNNEKGGEDVKIEESLQDNSKGIKDNNKIKEGSVDITKVDVVKTDIEIQQIPQKIAKTAKADDSDRKEDLTEENWKVNNNIKVKGTETKIEQSFKNKPDIEEDNNNIKGNNNVSMESLEQDPLLNKEQKFAIEQLNFIEEAISISQLIQMDSTGVCAKIIIQEQDEKCDVTVNQVDVKLIYELGQDIDEKLKSNDNVALPLLTFDSTVCVSDKNSEYNDDVSEIVVESENLTQKSGFEESPLSECISKEITSETVFQRAQDPSKSNGTDKVKDKKGVEYLEIEATEAKQDDKNNSCLDLKLDFSEKDTGEVKKNKFEIEIEGKVIGECLTDLAIVELRDDNFATAYKHDPDMKPIIEVQNENVASTVYETIINPTELISNLADVSTIADNLVIIDNIHDVTKIDTKKENHGTEIKNCSEIGEENILMVNVMSKVIEKSENIICEDVKEIFSDTTYNLEKFQNFEEGEKLELEDEAQLGMKNSLVEINESRLVKNSNTNGENDASIKENEKYQDGLGIDQCFIQNTKENEQIVTSPLNEDLNQSLNDIERQEKSREGLSEKVSLDTEEKVHHINQTLSNDAEYKNTESTKHTLDEIKLKQDKHLVSGENIEVEPNADVKLEIKKNNTNEQNTIFETQNLENSVDKTSNLNIDVVEKDNSKKKRARTNKKSKEKIDDVHVRENLELNNERNEVDTPKKEKVCVKENQLKTILNESEMKTNEIETFEGENCDMNQTILMRENQGILETKESDQRTMTRIDNSNIQDSEILCQTEKKDNNEKSSLAETVVTEEGMTSFSNFIEPDRNHGKHELSDATTELRKDISKPIKDLIVSEKPKDSSRTGEKGIESNMNSIDEMKSSEETNKINSEKSILEVQNEVMNNNKYKSISNEDKSGIITSIDSCIENNYEPYCNLSTAKDLTRDHLNVEVTNDLINLSQIRQIEFDVYKQKSDDVINNNKSVSSTSSNDVPKVKRLFVDHTKNDYENEFLKPPGYIEKKFTSDYHTSELDSSQSCTIYKAQTLVSNVQYKPTFASFSNNAINNDAPEANSDTKIKSKGLEEARKVKAEKRNNVLRDAKRKPIFSTFLSDRTAVEGSRVKLTCSVLTSTEPNIIWYKNGVPLDNKLKYRTKFLDGVLTMEVLNAVPSDTAEYSCTVCTDYGSVSTAANLKVYPSFEASPIPPTFTRSIRDNYHLAEDELVLECRIRGQPLPAITWLKDDRCIECSERYQAYYLADGVCRLVITKPISDDSGKYTCKAENSMWSDEISHVVTFTGKERLIRSNLAPMERTRLNRQTFETRRPHFSNVLSDYKVAKGGTIGLQVEIQGSPVRVEWLREGCSITEIYRHAQTFVDHGLYTLALTDVTEKESGIYTCRAWGNQGNVDMNAAITVVQPNQIDGKPAVIIGRPPKDVLITVGEDLNISFRVQGEPKPRVTFMKGIRDITNSQRVFKMTSDDYVKFTLKRSIVSDAGTYCILARNAYGCDRAFVTVVVRQRASSENLISDWTYPTNDPTIVIDERRFKSVPNCIPGEPSVVDGGNNWVSIAWPKPDSGSGAPVQAYKIESWLLGKEGGARWSELGITPLNSFDVFNLKQGEEYHFRITPRNRHGWGESVQTSNPIGVGIGGDRPEFIVILPGQLKVLLGETATLKCSFKGKPIPEIIWMKNGHEVDEEDKRLKIIVGDNESSLTIDGVRIEDEARYSCEATNIHGRASTYARVAVVTDRIIWEADAKLKRERSADVGGDCPPQFTMRLRDRRVQATYPVRLTCQVVGRPSPVVTWFKDGEEVEYGRRHTKSQDELFHTLEIAPTHLEDGGMYEAMARNSSGAISCRCNLVVDKGIRAYVTPEFCCGLEPLYQLSAGEELRMSAVVEAYPSVGVTWYRDGVRLRPSRRAVMTLDRDGQIELAVASVTQRDAGVYTCTASNEVGKASTSAKVEVLGDCAGDRAQILPTLVYPDVPYSKEPMFIRKPRSSEAREGDTVIIECEVIGDPKPDVYWLRDFLRPDYYRDASHFKRVGAGPEYRFEIPHAKLDYTGAYSVVARNQYGEAKAVISLQILAKDPRSSDEAHNIRYGRVEVIPRFEKELTDLLSHDGDAVEFECRVSGNPEPDIKWYHYNEYIRDCTDFETTYELGTARLKINQVTADDEGTYTCEARNSLGKAKSTACLIVYPPGEPNTLSQRLRRPPALLSSASTPRSTPARSMSRTRTPGQAGLLGLYGSTATAVPDMRSLSSPAREIAPKFCTYPFNKVAEEGDTVVFQCAVKGLPAPWATWDKDGVVITPSSRIAIKEKDEMLRILEIDEVNSEDVGLYRVTLENDYGRAEASARLEVISQTGKFYSGRRSYSTSSGRSYKRSLYSLPRHD